MSTNTGNTSLPARLHASWCALCQAMVSRASATDHRIQQAIAHAAGRKPQVRIAFSGGLDSTVLLHLLARMNLSSCAHAPANTSNVPRQSPAWVSGHAISAMHVHHGLSTNSDTWARHCRAQCSALDVPFTLRRVQVSSPANANTEEKAREARYAALLAAPVDIIALAHHADDQAETVLLQLLRGAGAKGLSAMAEWRMAPAKGLRRVLMWRPLLSCTRAELEAYARLHCLNWIEDESNADTRLRRNFVRAEVLPVLSKGFARPVTTLARSARLLAEVAYLADSLADSDLVLAHRTGGLDLAILGQHDDPRLKNLLRRWIELDGLRAPSEARLLALVRALRQSSNDTRLAWQHEGRVVRRKKGLLVLE